MAITTRRSGPDDRAAVLALMQRARGDDLTPEQRAERGFVQGTMTEQTLVRFEAGTGVFLAEDGGALAGFAMTAPAPPDRPAAGPGTIPVDSPGGLAVDAHPGPPALTVAAARAAVGDRRLFLYGPTTVDPAFQGRGVLTVLLTALSRELADGFDLGVAFVEDANHRSLAVHRHYGMTEVPGFVFDHRDYHVFMFAPSLFTARS